MKPEKQRIAYHIYNKILRTSRKANDLVLMFNPFKIITVDSDIKLNGRYEDDLFVVTKN
jgi:hypothetical protein